MIWVLRWAVHRAEFLCPPTLYIRAVMWDLQKCGTSEGSDPDEPAQLLSCLSTQILPASSPSVIKYSSDLQRLSSDYANAQAGQRPCCRAYLTFEDSIPRIFNYF